MGLRGLIGKASLILGKNVHFFNPFVWGFILFHSFYLSVNLTCQYIFTVSRF